MLYPHTNRLEVGDTLQQLTGDIGILYILRSDIVPENRETYGISVPSKAFTH